MVIPFKVGDRVTRDGTDVQFVVDTNASNGYPPDIITVICLKAPADGWCKVGEHESNLARRYSFAGETIDALRPTKRLT